MSCDPSSLGLRDASFRGVPFYVDSDKESYGRRIATHEFPMRDDPVHEDMGEKFASFTVTGYVWAEDISGELAKDAVREACVLRGPGLLILPATDPVMAVCPSVSISRSKDKLGWFEITFEFKREGDSSQSIGFVPYYGGEIDGYMSDAILAYTDFILSTVGLSNDLDYVVDQHAGRVQSFAADMISQIESTPYVDTTTGSDITRDATVLFLNARNLCDPTLSPDVSFKTTSSLMSSVVDTTVAYTSPTGPRTLVVTCARILQGIGDITDPVHGYKVFMDVAGRDYNPTAAIPAAPSDYQDAANDLAFNSMVRCMALTQAGRAAAKTAYATRLEAIQVRATLVEAFNQEIYNVGTQDAVVLALTKARDSSIQALSRQITTIAPVLTIEAPATMPSLYWSYRLYRNDDRARELSDRNNVPLSAFIPATFEALSR